MKLSAAVTAIRRLSPVLLVLAAVLVLLLVYLAIIWVATAAYFTSPNAQRIFYFHVPTAWVSYLAFGLLFVMSLAYLRSENPAYDRWAQAAAESAFVFATVALLSGTLWMRAEWLDSNTQIVDRFLWDARLSLTLVMWFILAGYVVLRRAAAQGQVERLAAVVAAFGFIAVPLSFFSARFLRSVHPNVVATSEGSISTEMLVTLNLGMVAFTLLFAYLMLMRTRMLSLRERVLTAHYDAMEG